MATFIYEVGCIILNVCYDACYMAILISSSIYIFKFNNINHINC